ncbi:hypothetical protein ACFLZX_04870 [Nanoarchaeota archaeon]
MMFSLDIFDMDLDFWGTLLGLFMHNIPALILLVVLLISWKYEIVGGIVFILAGIFYIAMVSMNPNFGPDILIPILIISGPAFLIGTLFLIGWIKKRSKPT